MDTQTTGTSRTRRRSGSRPAPTTTAPTAATKTTKTTKTSEPAESGAVPSQTRRTSTKRPSSNRGDNRGTNRGSGRGKSPAPTATLTGVVRMHPRGFAFVDADPTPDAATTAPTATVASVPSAAFVPPTLTTGLLTDDRVEVGYFLEDDGRATATTVTLLERRRTQLFGVLEDDEVHGLMLRVDPHVAQSRWRVKIAAVAATAGQAVLADIAGSRSVTPAAVFPTPTSGDALRTRILARHQIVTDYPQAVIDQVAASIAVTEAAQTAAGRSAGLHPTDTRVPRRDLRDLVTFTIDANSSRDLDDALSVYPAGPDGGLRVCVHIADVAAHVPAGSPVDVEARRTATSVYLPGWTRPMLPPALSEDALSLLPEAERDALTVEMRIMPDGQVTAADVYASRIVSNMRLSYDTAADILAGARPDDVPDEVVDALRWLRTAGARLGIQRARRGGVEARRVEPELTIALVDDVATQVTATPSNPAHLLIERLMVATNEAVDGWMTTRGLPTLHRAHPTPTAEATATLEAFCAAAGYHPGFGSQLTPLGLAALSEQLEGAADETASAVWDVLLSNLGRAYYTPDQAGHFGLASDGYLHFTSPIRRYADLVVHRVIRAYLAGSRDSADFPSYPAMVDLAGGINTGAGVAARAEAQMRKALWLVTLEAARAADPDTVLRGRVSGVNAKGVFVTLEHSHVSGFLPARDLPGRGWAPTDDGLGLVSADGARIGFGEQVEVRVASADVETGQLELRPKEARAARPAGGARHGTRRPATGRR